MEKEEYNSRFGRNFGPYTERNPSAPEGKRTWKRTALEIAVLTALALGGMYACWKAYDYADTQRRQTIQEER